MSISAVLIFLVILLVLVIIHEFGHFIVAKWTNMRVDEFAFGFPPRIYRKKLGETTYSLNALPIGGYVSIWGENGSEEDNASDGAKNNPRAFGNRPWWAQILVLLAGVTMNMLLALIILVCLSFGKVEMSADDPTYGSRVEDTSLVVLDAYPESPAYKAGLTPGSRLISVTSKNMKASLVTATSLVTFIENHSNDAITFVYEKQNGEHASTTVAAIYGIVPNKKAVGISVGTTGYVYTSTGEAIKLGLQRTKDITLLTFGGLKTLLVSAIHRDGSVLNSLSGPIGIAKIVGETSAYGIMPILTLVAILSINLAVFNILPLPALDGGRIIMVVIESISRRKIPFKYYSWLNLGGFALLLLLLVVVTVHDVIK
ncbi:MAG: rane-associated zinc metalloprotease [Candidatus Nomurabacteria bacterium]|nr:rane-associated zinc metalloprotease [Candidatus Nomurabacteria bacterium]